MKADLINFISPDAFKIIMKDQLDWFLGDFKIIDGLAIIKPDFYENGTVLATSKKAIIVCMGKSHFIINGREYTSIDEAIDQNGASILQSFDDWEWKMEKEWVIKKSNNGEWVKTCCVLSDFPYRK